MTTNGHSNGTVQFFDSVLAPRGKSPASRKSWGIDLEADWVPFFTAAKVAGKVNIADDVLGAPIRQAYNDDGTPKFSQSGRPVRRVHKDIIAHVTIARENFVAAMRGQVAVVATEQADAYRDQVEGYHDDVDLIRLLNEYGQYGVTEDELKEIPMEERELVCSMKRSTYWEDIATGKTKPSETKNGQPSSGQPPPTQPSTATKEPVSPAGASAPSDAGGSGAPPQPPKFNDTQGPDAMAENIGQGWETPTPARRG